MNKQSLTQKMQGHEGCKRVLVKQSILCSRLSEILNEFRGIGMKAIEKEGNLQIFARLDGMMFNGNIYGNDVYNRQLNTREEQILIHGCGPLTSSHRDNLLCVYMNKKSITTNNVIKKRKM